MKKILLSAFLAFSFSAAYSQSPEMMSYQAVIRNSANHLTVNQQVGVRLSVLQGNPEGNTVYSETHTLLSNGNGLITLQFGGGTPVSGTFEQIDWANGPYFIKSETDVSGGTNYTITGTSQMLTVPYALYAKTSGSSVPGPQGPAGPAGEIGLTGPVGPQGIQGETGPQGPIGLTGPVGPQGIQGETGAQGPIGLTGPEGPQGIQGETGIQGPIGLTGPAGPQGIQGETGIQGPNGLTGPAGPQGIQGETGEQGLTGPVGPQGIQGERGEQGPIGLTGPVGPQGIQGERGEQGPIGLTGPAGPQGIQGETGAQGSIGLTGPVGPQGIQGETGEKGPIGLTGPAGPQGIQGQTGEQGLTGPSGPQGMQGFGVPQGGTTGQILTKVDGTNYNTQWTTPVMNAGGGAILELFATSTIPQTNRPFAYGRYTFAFNTVITGVSASAWTANNTFTVPTGKGGLYNISLSMVENDFGAFSSPVLVFPEVHVISGNNTTYYYGTGSAASVLLQGNSTDSPAVGTPGAPISYARGSGNFMIPLQEGDKIKVFYRTGSNSNCATCAISFTVDGSTYLSIVKMN